jgi:hypothetical protein
MGWHLVAEILDHCPDLKYREFRVLVSWALDANDDTRQGMPGGEKLSLQANCKMRQTMEAMSSLRKRGILKTVRKSAPGVRAVYEMPPMCTGNGCGHGRTRSGAGKRPTHADSRATHADSGPTHADQHRAHSVTISSHKTQSSLSRAVAAIQAAVPDATEREIREIVSKIEKDPSVRYAAAYLRTAVGNGDAPVLVIEARSRLAERDAMAQMTQTPASGRGQWCGQCDERTRMLGWDTGSPRHCPNCHRSAAPASTANGGPPDTRTRQGTAEAAMDAASRLTEWERRQAEEGTP